MSVKVPIPLVAAILLAIVALLDPAQYLPATIIPSPAPITTDGLRVLVVEETAERSKLPAGQLAVLMGTEWRAFVKDAKGEWRLLDKDADIAKESPWVKQAFGLPRDGTPWIVAGNGKAGFSGPLPNELPGMMELLKKYGGAK